MSKYEKILGSWFPVLKEFTESDAFKKIGHFIQAEINAKKTIIPATPDIFRAFRLCPYDQLNTVIISSNAYVNGEGHDGMALSCCRAKFDSDVPPMLKRVFDAIEQDVGDGLYLIRDTDLKRWSEQGILLLNVDLTSEFKKPGSHVDLWKPFIEEVLSICAKLGGVQFVFLGKEAQKYVDVVNNVKQVNDIYLLEHPQRSAIENRPWRHQSIFSRIRDVVKFLHNKTIIWK